MPWVKGPLTFMAQHVMMALRLVLFLKTPYPGLPDIASYDSCMRGMYITAVQHGYTVNSLTPALKSTRTTKSPRRTSPLPAILLRLRPFASFTTNGKVGLVFLSVPKLPPPKIREPWELFNKYFCTKWQLRTQSRQPLCSPVRSLYLFLSLACHPPHPTLPLPYLDRWCQGIFQH